MPKDPEPRRTPPAPPGPTTDYTFTGTVSGGGTIAGTITMPNQPVPPNPNPPNGGSMAVEEGLSGASQSYPAVSGFAGYGTEYLDDRTPSYFRTINPGFNGVLTISPGAWPPGYRVPNGQKGGGYPASGSQATGNEPIRLQPPVSGVNRVIFHTRAKIVITNPGTGKGSYTCGLGVVYVNGPDRPMFPYLGYAHDLDINQFRPVTIGPGDTQNEQMFRADTVDNNMDGGAVNFPDWPKWEMTPSSNLLYPAVGISFKNTGNQILQVGQIFAIGWVS